MFYFPDGRIIIYGIEVIRIFIVLIGNPVGQGSFTIYPVA